MIQYTEMCTGSSPTYLKHVIT